ncbi:MAG: His-Xaa-Ser system radical SAM maturase HxsB [Bacilli bacterium]|nr:His-Xaa-Ser system radical SAM maturase HxsB [Candidatus Paceibacterota bacterium]MDD4411707.1 His-Xaa-Ser system radical SAM maturase HxsB [Bacilli bacterium]
MEFDKIKINKNKVGFFRFKKLNDFYLLTNDIHYIQLDEEVFKDFLEGTLDEGSIFFKELAQKGFIKNIISVKELAKEYKKKNIFLFQKGISLHIIIVTKRCNHCCIYCQAGSPELQDPAYDMTEETARKTVDLIFQTPSLDIKIDFQGGEPLVNWEIVRFIIEYAIEKNKVFKKRLTFSLITNLTLMTDEIYQYLLDKRVDICTSLDGPEHVHNKNRLFPGGSYRVVVNWIEKMKSDSRNIISALPTLTRYSLKHIKEVVDEYIKHDFKIIHLKPLNYFGRSSGSRDGFGYTSEEFIFSWKVGMDYIILKNKEGINIQERIAKILLNKILKNEGSSYIDLRSPCGLGIGVLSYSHDGYIYACEGGRLLENDNFILGSIDNTYQEIVNNPKNKILIQSSILENFACDQCVYKPYCGVCPVLNYALYKNLFPNIKATDKCNIHRGMLDYLFLKMREKEILAIFKKWI